MPDVTRADDQGNRREGPRRRLTERARLLTTRRSLPPLVRRLTGEVVGVWRDGSKTLLRLDTGETRELAFAVPAEESLPQPGTRLVVELDAEGEIARYTAA